MDVQYSTINEPATAEYVLAVLQDMHRQQCEHDPEAEPDAVLTLDTTVAEWRWRLAPLARRRAGRAPKRVSSLAPPPPHPPTICRRISRSGVPSRPRKTPASSVKDAGL